MSLRIVYDGQYTVERGYESHTGRVMWVWVATFHDLAEAKRCYPGAQLLSHEVTV